MTNPPDRPKPAASPSSPGDTPDWVAEALAALDGDRELLAAVIEATLDDAPRLLGEIRRAIEARDPPTLRRAAHNLKGAVRYFGDVPAYQHAYRLECLGKDGDLEPAPEALARLEAAVAQLTLDLVDYLRGCQPPGHG